MYKADTRTRAAGRARRGFTIIELLVVVAIIALLLAILMPSLAEARREARAVQCATNLKHVGTAVATYQTVYNVYPVSYAYLGRLSTQANRVIVDISPEGQDPTLANQKYQGRGYSVSDANGYAHWSHFLYSNGKVDDKSFQCPEFDNGGAPRTNPGLEQENWEPGQVDATGNSSPNPLEDYQATRMSYTANAAVMPRNKFTTGLSGGLRVNRLVGDSMIRNGSQVVLAAEFYNNWEVLTASKGNGLLSKSHRPISVFYSKGGGWNEYAERENRSLFVYGDPSDASGGFGLLPQASLKGGGGIKSLLEEGAAQANKAKINALGRHHPGGDEYFGGTVNFLYVDAHVERKSIIDTMEKREWGESYYSLSGANQINHK